MEKHRSIYVCQETPCLSMGSGQLYEAFKREVRRQGLNGVAVEISGCHGHGVCDHGPSVVVEPEGVFYVQVEERDVFEIVSSHLTAGNPVSRLFYRDPESGLPFSRYREMDFFKRQKRLILANCGRINPEKIETYLKQGGYRALVKTLGELSPRQVIEEINRAHLRGRGGAGFPTGRKWEFCRLAPGEKRYVVCNADEGDPGAFMDRSLLEANPHSIIEGLIIAGYAVGAGEGYIYVRAEYPLAVKRVRLALNQARDHGFLEKNILGSGFDFTIKIKEGAGSFVCGEETALIASLESRRGMPRPRPPFPAQSGLAGKPTVINNVKTLAYVPLIIEYGGDWFARIGTEKSKGTAVFALTGKIRKSGLVEVPMGTPLSNIVFDIGGGIPRERRFKALQTGGPSGGCIPAQYLDLPVDYETLGAIGSIMGSGGMVVMDEATCMVEVARYFLSFTEFESCGKCVPCRLGIRQMLQIVTGITRGKGVEKDLDKLLSLAKTVKESSLCGLGQTCPNPVLTTLKYFRDEYLEHIREKRCPAAVCEALMISPCQHTCPVGIDVPKYLAHIAAGEYLEAVETIRERNPFPAICGRICHHPCERRCRRGDLDESVDIRALKRFAADWYFSHLSLLPESTAFPVTKSKRVAVVGAGPCGLSCAYFLAQMGYPVVVFESLPVGGGMPSVAIPDFRLPREVVEKEIEEIRKRGVEIRYNTPIGVNYTIENLQKEGFAAVFIAAGAQAPARLGIPGEIEDLEGFAHGLRFLRDVKVGRPVRVGKRAAIIGGGNVALDVARTALRLGAEEANVYYRRSREEMPVTEVEYKEALLEGIEIHFLVSPTRIESQKWRVTGFHAVRMRLGEPDAAGRRRPVPIAGSDFFIEVDTVVAAVGQAPDLSFLPADSVLERTRWERLLVDANSLATNVSGVFAGGDFVSGPGMVIEAIAAGIRGAEAIDKYFRGDTSRVQLHDYDLKRRREAKSKEGQNVWETQLRPVMARLSKEERRTFRETELGYPEEEARREAGRCLRCDLERQEVP